MRYSLIDPQGNVENIIEYEPPAKADVDRLAVLRAIKEPDDAAKAELEQLALAVARTTYTPPDGYTFRKAKVSDEITVADVAPTLDDRLRAIENAITNSSDFSGMKTELLVNDDSAVELAPAKKP